MRRTIFLSLVLLLAVPPSLVLGGEKCPEDDQLQTVKLTVHPAPEPRPALKYQLLPSVLDRRPGNAAVVYSKLAILLAQDKNAEEPDKAAQWLDTPLAELPRDKIRAILSKKQSLLAEFRVATRYATCDWQMSLRQLPPFTILLPELQNMRNLARLIALKARLETAEGRFDEALETLEQGYALGRHVAEGPTLINSLVGIAICGMMTRQLETLVQQPEAPNLYWAISSLPRPLIDMRKAWETESNMLFLWKPELLKIGDKPHGVEYWQTFLDELREGFLQPMGVGLGSVKAPRLGFAALAVKAYPVAKRYLVEQGLSPEQVEALPVAEVVARHALATYIESRDQLFKWFSVPYWQARDGFHQAEASLRADKSDQNAIPLARLLLPALSRAALSSANNERRIALAQTVEALRMHAADHEGRLPASLDDVEIVPIPQDPVTGKTFGYRLQGDTAVLAAPAPAGESPKRFGRRLEISIAK